MKDRDYTADGYNPCHVMHGKFTIDGQGHYINFADYGTAIYSGDKLDKYDYQEDWQFKNAHLYEVDFYGVFSANSGTSHASNIENGHAGEKGYNYTRVTYGPNIDFTGAQLTWSSVASDCLQIDIEGKVTARSVPFYKYNGYIYKTHSSSGDQQIFQAYRFFLNQDLILLVIPSIQTALRPLVIR